MLDQEKIRKLLVVIHENNINKISINNHTVKPLYNSLNFEIDGEVCTIDSAIIKILERR